MKNLIITILFCASFGGVFAQESNVTLPEYQEVVMMVKDDNALTALDKTDIVTESKQNGMRRILVYMKAMGSNAHVSAMGSPKDRFVVNIQQRVDPDDVVELFKFDELTSKSRKILIASISGGWGKTKDIQLPKQRLSFKKVANGSFIISPENQLEAGEYVFIVNRPNISELGTGGKPIKGYCFSVK